MRRNLIEVQVKRIEVAFSPDLVPVLNGDPTSAMIDKAIFRECLQGSIDMNAGHPGRVPQLLLRHRQMKVSRIDNTGSVHANGATSSVVNGKAATLSDGPRLGCTVRELSAYLMCSSAELRRRTGWGRERWWR